MSKNLHILLTAAALLLCVLAKGQGKMIGAYNSPKGFGLSYVKTANNERGLKCLNSYVDLFDVFTDRSSRPGVISNYSYLSIFTGSDYEDFAVYFIAGPGLSLGWSNDFKRENFGLVCALSGTAGFLMDFDRRVSICLSITSNLGMSIVNEKDKGIDMYVYSYGVLQTLLPQISIYFRL